MKHAFNPSAYSSFPAWLPCYPLDEAIRRIAAIGYDGVEIGCAAPPAYCVESYFSGFYVESKKKLSRSVFGQVHVLRVLAVFFSKVDLELTSPDFPGPLGNLYHPEISNATLGRASKVRAQISSR